MFDYFEVTLFLFICLSCHYSISKLDDEFIIDYFSQKQSSSIIVFHCNENGDVLHFIRELSALQIKSLLLRTDVQTEYNWSSFSNPTNSKNGVVFDLRCHTYNEFQSSLNKASDYRMFDESFNWLIIGVDLNESLELINDESFGLSTDFVIAVKKMHGYNLYDVYNPCKACGSNLNVTWIGTWDKKRGFNFIKPLIKSHRWNLRGIKLKLSGLINNRPENVDLKEHLRDYNSKFADPTAKMAYALWIPLSEMFNFTLVYQGKTVWKKGDKNGPVMNSLLTGESDATGTPVTMTIERLRFGKPVYPALPFRSCFFFRSVSSSRINFKLILEPFSPEVWHYIILFGMLSINVMVLLSLFQPVKLGDKYISSIMINISAFCQQGVDFQNNKLSGRIALLYIYVFNLLLNNYYMASLVSCRLKNSHNTINDSLNQLTKVSLTFAAEKSLYFDFYMKRSDWETKSFYTNVWAKIPDNKKFLPPAHALPLVSKGGFAYHTLPEYAYPYIERFFDDRQICEMSEVHLVRPTQLAFFVHRNSSFTEMMRCGFAKVTEYGIRNREIVRWIARKPHCRIDVLTTETVTFDETAPVIIFMFISIILSVVLLIMERIFYFKF